MDVKQEVITLIGQVSSCFENPDAAGGLDEEKVRALGKRFIDRVSAYMEGSPRLGHATTLELINELHVRADVSHLNGEEWPSYRTAGSE